MLLISLNFRASQQNFPEFSLVSKAISSVPLPVYTDVDIVLHWYPSGSLFWSSDSTGTYIAHWHEECDWKTEIKYTIIVEFRKSYSYSNFIIFRQENMELLITRTPWKKISFKTGLWNSYKRKRKRKRKERNTCFFSLTMLMSIPMCFFHTNA